MVISSLVSDQEYELIMTGRKTVLLYPNTLGTKFFHPGDKFVFSAIGKPKIAVEVINKTTASCEEIAQLFNATECGIVDLIKNKKEFTDYLLNKFADSVYELIALRIKLSDIQEALIESASFIREMLETTAPKAKSDGYERVCNSSQKKSE